MNIDKFRTVFQQTVGLQSYNLNKMANSAAGLSGFYRLTTDYSDDVIERALAIVKKVVAQKPSGFDSWLNPNEFYDALLMAKSETEQQPDYCPCCSGTGRITPTTKQMAEYWHRMQIESPPRFEQARRKGKFKVSAGDIMALTGIMACGCREVNVATGEDRQNGTVKLLAEFTSFFPEKDSKCLANDVCKPIIGNGRNCCPQKARHHAEVEKYRLNLTKECPYYKKGLAIRERVSKIPVLSRSLADRKISDLESTSNIIERDGRWGKFGG